MLVIINYLRDHSLNCTPLGPVTITSQTLEQCIYACNLHVWSSLVAFKWLHRKLN